MTDKLQHRYKDNQCKLKLVDSGFNITEYTHGFDIVNGQSDQPNDKSGDQSLLSFQLISSSDLSDLSDQQIRSTSFIV